MTKFEAGRTYGFEWHYGEGGGSYFSIVSRTEKIVVIDYQGEQKRRKIYTDKDGEYIMPTGSYPYAPIGHSENVWKEEPDENTIAEFERLETALEGKSERKEVEEILENFSETTLKEYMIKESYYCVDWNWTKADFIEEIAWFTAKKAHFAEVRKSLEGITLDAEAVEKLAVSIAKAVKNGGTEEEVLATIAETITEETEKKMTAEQAIEEIRVLTTEEEIKSVLMNCNEADVCVIGKEFTGDKWVFQPEYITRECLIKLVARRIAYLFEQNAFLSLTAEEQVAELLKTEPDRVGKKLALCETEQDVYAIASALGLNVEDYNSFYYLIEAIKLRIRAMQAKFSETNRKVEKFIPVINGRTYISFVDGHDEERYHSEIPKWVEL